MNNNQNFTSPNPIPHFFLTKKSVWGTPVLAIIIVCFLNFFFQNYSSYLENFYPLTKEMLTIEYGAYLALLNCFGYWLFIRLINHIGSYLTGTVLFQRNPSLSLVLPFFLTILKAIILLTLFNIFIQHLSLSQEFSYFFEKLSSVLIISSISFALFKLIDIVEGLLKLHFTAQSGGNLSERKIYTQTLILKRIAYGVIAIFSIGAILILFDNVRALGASVLTTAGIAGLVLTFTAQRSLGSIFSGLEIALTQPIKIGDIVVIENQTGTVEEINFRSVVLKLGNWRRLIVPTNYFLEKSFENLDRVQNSNLIGNFCLYVDFTLPVKSLRSYFESILKKSPLWDRNTCSLKVSALHEQVMELQISVSAANNDDVSNLLDYLREELITYVVEKHSTALPLTRSRTEEI